jgi:hypothetical protein
MPNDAKIGLAVGLGLVIGVAVMFYRKDPGPKIPSTGEAPPVQATVPPPAPRGVYRPVNSQTVTRSETVTLEEPREMINTESRGRQESSRGIPDW